MTNDDDPFFIQFYRKNDDPEVYGDENLPLLFGIDQACAFCKAKHVALKKKKDWLQCKLCEQLPHQSCFQK